MDKTRTVSNFLKGDSVSIKSLYEIMDMYNLKDEKSDFDWFLSHLRTEIKLSKPFSSTWVKHVS